MRLSIPTLGKILRLADLVTAQNVRESEEDGGGGDCGKTIDRIQASLDENHAMPRAERDLELIFEALPHQELRECDALYRFGRSESDTFEFLCENPRETVEMIPWTLSQKTDLHDSLINGLKRLGESHAKTAVDTGETAA